MMMRLRHPRIVGFLGAGELIDPPRPGEKYSRRGLFVVLEYVAGGDLSDRLKEAAGDTILLPWKVRIQCALDIAEGMEYIHSKGRVHRDLKSMNVLCDLEGRCKIADLGLATAKDEDQEFESKEEFENELETGMGQLATGWRGTSGWMAPEVSTIVENQNGRGLAMYGPSVDVYSFGVIMWELVTCRVPWLDSEYNFANQILNAVKEGERPTTTKEELDAAPKDFVTLMHACWEGDASKRPDFSMVLLKLRNISTNCTERPLNVVPIDTLVKLKEKLKQLEAEEVALAAALDFRGAGRIREQYLATEILLKQHESEGTTRTKE